MLVSSTLGMPVVIQLEASELDKKKIVVELKKKTTQNKQLL